MTKVTLTAMTFGGLERALLTTLRVDPDKTETFRARLKQLQRLGFPPGVNVGRGTKMSYGTEHLVQLMFAFELISTGIPAKTATEMVLQGWGRIRSACRVIGQNDPAMIDTPIEILVAFRPDLLGQPPTLVLPTIEDVESLRDRLRGKTLPGTYIVLEASRLVHRLLNVGGEAGRIVSHMLYRELRSWPGPPRFDFLGPDEDNWYRVGAFDAEGVIIYDRNPKA